MSLTQVEYSYYMGLEKQFKEPDELVLGPAPIHWKRDLLATTTKDSFILHFRRGSIELKKFTYNKTIRTCVVLLRYDAMGRHTNPPEADGKTFDGPHVHLYREGFDDKWAFPVTEIGLSDNPPPTMEDVFNKIASFCNIVGCPHIQSSLC